MRQGELLALRWQDVNLERASLVVRGSLARLPGPKGVRYVITEPKTDRSRRTVPLVPEVVAVLRTLRKAQMDAKRPQGYVDQGLVFCTAYGSPLDAAKVSRLFTRAVVAAGLPKVRFHDMRHGAASMLIEKGVELATVSRILGHSNIATTMDTYGHLSEGHRAAAMARLVEVG
jgi:integrase